ncbi:hypothetical protein THAOC_23395, partial [Thalassiosira oceanica]
MEDARKRPRMDDGGYSPPAAASSTVKLLANGAEDAACGAGSLPK